MKTLGLIPARGGSKGVPGKNVRPLCGKPLIAWAVEAALSARAAGALYRVIVSTDDDRIAEAARAAGAEVPFTRPAELAADATPMIPVIQHAVRFVEAADGPVEAVMLVQPTNPFVRADDIVKLLALMKEQGAESGTTVARWTGPHPDKFKEIRGGLLVPHGGAREEDARIRQAYPDLYVRTGSLYAMGRDLIVERGKLWGERVVPLVVEEERAVDIDTEIDFLLAEALMRRRLGG